MKCAIRNIYDDIKRLLQASFTLIHFKFKYYNI